MVVSAEPLAYNFWVLAIPEIAPPEYKSQALHCVHAATPKSASFLPSSVVGS